MIKEALQWIRDVADDAKKVEFREHPQQLNRVAIITGGKVEWLEAQPAARKQRLLALDDFVEACQDKEIAPNPEIYYSLQKITVLLDRANRHESLSLHLVLADEFLTVCKSFGAEDGYFGDSKALTRFLKSRLPQAGGEQLVRAISHVDFTRKGTGQATVEHGRESLGRAVELEVAQAKDIPESVTFSVPVFATTGLHDFKTSITCSVYVDLDEQGFRVKTYPDAIERAKRLAAAYVDEKLSIDLDCQIFNGEA